MSEMNLKQEMREAIEKKGEESSGFVRYSHLRKHAFARYEAVNEAYDLIQNVIAETGGVMPIETLDAYEALANLMESIKTFELDTIRNGR